MELIVTAKAFLRNVVSVEERYVLHCNGELGASITLRIAPMFRWVKKLAKRVRNPDVYRLTGRTAPVAPVLPGATPKPSSAKQQNQGKANSKVFLQIILGYVTNP